MSGKCGGHTICQKSLDCSSIKILNNFGVMMVHQLAEIIVFGVQGKHGHEEMQYIIQ